ncbi:MAG: glycosyltransferase [Acetatifactor sp.]
MRIAFMTNNYKPFIGGVPISIERLARGLEAMGHQVTIFAPTYQEQEEEENVFRYGTLFGRFIGGIVLPNPFDLRIEKEFREKKYDIIHVHHPMLVGRTAVYLSRKYGVPLVFTYHTRYEKYVESYSGGMIKADKLMPMYLHTFLRHCSYVFAPTAGIQNYLTDTCKVSPDRVGILPTGIEEKNYHVTEAEKEEIRKEYDAMDCPLFLTVSRMAQEKNVDFLLESLSEFQKRFGKPFRMLMVGDGPYKLKFEKKCEDLQLQDKVIFTGTIPNEELSHYFAAADAFLFASKTETQGIVVLEAFAGATPVLAVRASGVEDLVTTGVNGILTSEKKEEYAGMLQTFCEDNLKRADMAENAYQSGLAYREEAVAKEALRIYNEVVTAARAVPVMAGHG